jgi:hypothetical protein
MERVLISKTENLWQVWRGLDSGAVRANMLPDAILASWRAWLIWCQISQMCFVLQMAGEGGIVTQALLPATMDHYLQRFRHG